MPRTMLFRAAAAVPPGGCGHRKSQAHAIDDRTLASRWHARQAHGTPARSRSETSRYLARPVATTSDPGDSFPESHHEASRSGRLHHISSPSTGLLGHVRSASRPLASPDVHVLRVPAPRSGALGASPLRSPLMAARSWPPLMVAVASWHRRRVWDVAKGSPCANPLRELQSSSRRGRDEVGSRVGPMRNSDDFASSGKSSGALGGFTAHGRRSWSPLMVASRLGAKESRGRHPETRSGIGPKVLRVARNCDRAGSTTVGDRRDCGRAPPGRALRAAWYVSGARCRPRLPCLAGVIAVTPCSAASVAAPVALAARCA
jgi:hypothetical protein